MFVVNSEKLVKWITLSLINTCVLAFLLGFNSSFIFKSKKLLLLSIKTKSKNLSLLKTEFITMLLLGLKVVSVNVFLKVYIASFNMSYSIFTSVCFSDWISSIILSLNLLEYFSYIFINKYNFSILKNALNKHFYLIYVLV